MIGRVLMLLTTIDNITLKNGEILKTGYDQFALVEVVDKFVSENLAFDVATTGGHIPHQDPNCLNHLPQDDLAYYKKYMEIDPILLMPKNMSSLSEEQLHHYVALYIPGGYAALEEFRASPDVLKILKHFHKHNKPIGMIGAGTAALIQNDLPWIFSDYKITCLNEDVESELEEHLLHTQLPYHVGYILEQLGARTTYVAPLETHVVNHKELLTGQNKFSAYDFAVQFALKIKYALKITD